MVSSALIVSICMGHSIKRQRINVLFDVAPVACWNFMLGSGFMTYFFEPFVCWVKGGLVSVRDLLSVIVAVPGHTHLFLIGQD